MVIQLSDRGNMWRDFKDFLLKQNVVALAIAVVIGAALNKLVTAVVEGLIMPFVGTLSRENAWRTATVDVGPAKLGIGEFSAALLNFIIVAFVAWRVARLLIREREADRKIKCAFCVLDVDRKARRCPHCTSELAPT